MKCNICTGETLPFQRATILKKYDVQYFRCPACGFIQTEAPYWLDEAYADAINASDVGLVARNLEAARVTKAVIKLFFRGDATFIDYGGGYGLFVRLLRDCGFDFYRYDVFCGNLFAHGLDVAIPESQQYELATAFEVFEHLVRPLQDIATIASFSDSILFTTTLIPKNTPALENWWYYGLDHGQHVSLYSLSSLSKVAAHLDLHLYSNGTNVHLLTKKAISPLLFRLAINWYVSMLLNLVRRRRPLIADDYFRISGRKLR